MIHFDIIAPVPEILDGWRTASLLGKAAADGLLAITVVPLRDFATDKHRMIDDRPFGGGAGMVLKPEPLFAAIESRKALSPPERTRILLLAPSGLPFTQARAAELAAWAAGPIQENDATAADSRFILVCGRYEGVDERVIDAFRPELISIGDYVIAGGEVAAMVVVEAVARLQLGVCGNADSTREESFSLGSGETLLEYPHYTRPAEFRGQVVPEVLQGGNHAEIARWREGESRRRTRQRRPDLLKVPVSD